MTAEDALEDKEDDNIIQNAMNVKFNDPNISNFPRGKKVGTIIRNKIKKSVKHNVNLKFVSDFNTCNNSSKNVVNVTLSPSEKALVHKRTVPENRRVRKTLSQLIRLYERNDVTTSNNYIGETHFVSNRRKRNDESWIDSESHDITYNNNYIENIALDYSINNRNDIDEIVGKLDGFNDDESDILSLCFSSDEENLSQSTNDTGNTVQSISSLKSEAIVTKFLELIPRYNALYTNYFIDSNIISPNMLTLDKYDYLCEYSNDKILEVLNEINFSNEKSVGYVVIEDIYNIILQWSVCILSMVNFVLTCTFNL